MCSHCRCSAGQGPWHIDSSEFFSCLRKTNANLPPAVHQWRTGSRTINLSCEWTHCPSAATKNPSLDIANYTTRKPGELRRAAAAALPRVLQLHQLRQAPRARRQRKVRAEQLQHQWPSTPPGFRNSFIIQKIQILKPLWMSVQSLFPSVILGDQKVKDVSDSRADLRQQ